MFSPPTGRLGCGDYLEVLADELRAGVQHGHWGMANPVSEGDPAALDQLVDYRRGLWTSTLTKGGCPG